MYNELYRILGKSTMRDFENIKNLGQIDTSYKGESILKIDGSDLIKCEFLRCMIHDIEKSSFYGSNFADCNMRDLQAKKNDLSYINIKTSDLSTGFFHHSTIKHSGFLKIDFRATIFKYGEVEESQFEDCDFTKSVFNGITFKNVSFKDCDFNNSAFRKCKFLACDFSEIRELQKCFFAECDMIECAMPEGDNVVTRKEYFYLDEENGTDEVMCLSIDFIDNENEVDAGDKVISDNSKVESL